MIVVDTNTVAYLFLPGDHTESARAALRREPAWAAPLLWRSEMRNVLAVQLRQEHMSLPAAREVMTLAEALLAGREFAVESGRVLELAAASGRSAYDCEFVALARAIGTPLLTSDRQLLKVFPETAISLAQFADGG